jgi:beta-glucanase (GH16 family)
MIQFPTEVSSVIRHANPTTRLTLLFVLSVLLFALPKSAAGQCGTTPATGSVTWTTNWCDEFNGAANSAIDPTKWTYDTGGGGWGNNELETYCAPTSNAAPCSTSSPNEFIDGSGHLVIQVRAVGTTYTSARLKTQGLQSFHAGRIEASIQIPSHAGLWPAFWMLGSQAGLSWPAVATSNIPGPGATGNCSTIHTKVTGGSGKGKCFTLPNGGRVDTAFHVYGEIWSANMIQFYVDDANQPFFVGTASDLPSGDVWPFSSSADSFFLIMNMAVGGTLGAPTDSATGSQAPMLVDYVRQYLPSAIPAPQLTASGNITVTAGATSGNTTTIDMNGTLGSGRAAFSCSTNAPKASCVVTSNDSVNNHTIDFSNSSTGSATVTVTTTANTRRGGHSNGTPPGSYTVTVNAYTISSSDATKPSASTTFGLTVN